MGQKPDKKRQKRNGEGQEREGGEAAEDAIKLSRPKSVAHHGCLYSTTYTIVNAYIPGTLLKMKA